MPKRATKLSAIEMLQQKYEKKAALKEKESQNWKSTSQIWNEERWTWKKRISIGYKLR